MAWELYIKDGNANDAWVVDDAGAFVAAGMGPMARDNARLIAAAPVMLAKLGALVWQLDRMDDLPEELEIMVAEAKAAIAQAKGEA
jgi:hypothetical protein